MSEATVNPSKKEDKIPPGAVHAIELEDGRNIYLSKPNRLVIESALVQLSNLTTGANSIKAGEIIINSCRVGGVSPKELEKEDPESFCSACISACDILVLKQATLKKL